MSEIRCETIERFIEICAGLAREGIVFAADGEKLIIKLTGGF